MNKTVVTQEQFQKKVEIESAHLIYMDRLPKNVADQKAKEIVAQKFEVK